MIKIQKQYTPGFQKLKNQMKENDQIYTAVNKMDKYFFSRLREIKNK